MDGGRMRPNPPRTTLPYLCGGDPHVFYTALTFTIVIYELAKGVLLQGDHVPPVLAVG